MLSAFYERSHLFGLAWTQMPLRTLKGAVSFLLFHFHVLYVWSYCKTFRYESGLVIIPEQKERFWPHVSESETSRYSKTYLCHEISKHDKVKMTS